MQLNPSEISELIKSKIQNLDTGATIRTQGTVVSISDGIARVHGLSDAMAGEMLEFPRQHVRPRAEPRARLRRRGDSRRVRAHHRRRHGQVHRPHPVGAGRPRADRPRRELAGPADRRQGSGHRQGVGRHREGRAGRDLAQVGVAAGADGPEIDRLDGADRPRPARAHHRRPPDRQDRGGDRHDHQPEGQGPHLHLRRHRPEGVVGQERDPQARGVRGDGLHHRPRGHGLRIGGDAVHRALFRLHDGRVLPRPRPGRAHHLRRPDEAGVGVPAGVAAPAPSAGPRSLSGRRVLPPLPAARARRARVRGVRREVHQGRGQGQDRLAHRAADHRDAGGRRDGVRADQRDLDHRRPDLPRNRPLQRRRPARDQRGHLGVAGRRRGADQGDQEAGRRRAPVARAIPRARGLRAVRLRPRRSDAEAARPRPARHRAHEAAAVRAAAGERDGGDAVQRQQGLLRRRAGREGARRSRSRCAPTSRASTRR